MNSTCGKKLAAVLAFFYLCMLNGCNTIYRSDPKKSAAIRLAITPPDTVIQKQHNGVDFFAGGNDPVAWTIDMDMEKDFRFESANTTMLIAPVAQSAKDAGANADSYRTTTDAGPMTVLVYNTGCTGNENREGQSRKVEVTVNNKRYTGCGSFLYDARLNDIWTLDYIDNTITEDDHDQKAPWLEFNLQKNKMYGYDGCNNISSNIAIQGNRIKFDLFAGVKKTCTSNEAGKLFSEMLSGHLVDYAMKDEKLILYLINDSKLIFKKKEQ